MATKKKTTEKTEERKIVSDAELAQQEISTKRAIAASPKVQVYIAPDGKDPMWRGCINGVDYKFQKGEVIEVPEPLADLIRNTANMHELAKSREKALIQNINLGSM